MPGRDCLKVPEIRKKGSGCFIRASSAAAAATRWMVAAAGSDLNCLRSARRIDRRRLIDSILRPSKEIAPQYVTWSIETTDGKVLSGLLLGELPDGTQTLVDSRGEKFSIPAEAIAQRALQSRSLMPDGLQLVLTVEEFRDLLAYLKPTDPAKTAER